MSQQDSLRSDARGEAHLTNRCQDGETPRHTALTDTAATGAPGDEAVQQQSLRHSWNPLRGLVRLRTFAALRYREFLLLWSGQASTSMAMWMDQVVRGWLMYELTNSPAQLGLVHGVQAVPILVLSPIAGSVADRYPRRQLLVVAQLLAAVMYAMLALLIVTGHIQPWHLYATAFGMAIVQTYSPSAFRGRTMAIFHMSSVVLTLGSLLTGTLAALVGARWAVAAMGAAGVLFMAAIGVTLPRVRLIR